MPSVARQGSHFVTLVAAHLASAHVALWFVDGHEQIALIRPPAGVAFAARVLFGLRRWPSCDQIADIGRMMHKEPIAEDAETESVRDRLIELGVGYAQGYAVDEPMPIERYFDAARLAGAT